MGQGHGDSLAPGDAAFLTMETATLPMHGGGLFVFDASRVGAVGFPRFLALVRSRLDRIPRYRQRLAFTPFGLSPPVWVDDPQFDIAYHVRHAALPRPGTSAQLMEYCARILSRPLDRDRPLWELYVIEGLEDDRVALLAKSHHALIDGVSGLDIVSVMLDDAPDASSSIPPADPWEPEPTPSDYELVFSAAAELLTSPAAAVASVRRVAAAPGNAARRALQVGRGVAAVARANVMRPAPQSPLNVSPGPHRRFAIQRLPLVDVKRVKNAFDTTVNDVVLTLAGDATGRYLRSRGARTDGLWLRALVPLSVHGEDGDEGPVGSRLTSVFVNLPVFEMDPVERLRTVADEMAGAARSSRAVGADFLVGLGSFAPPTIHATAARLAARTRLYNFVVTNVPGPQEPIYCLGARLLGAFPFTPLSANQAYAVGVTSIDGWLNVGVTADYDALPDVERVTDELIGALADLSASAEAVATRHELASKAHRSAKETADAARAQAQRRHDH
ncbi:MAG: wax ester/triacylglycerol synthase family O-acyltransferase [Actinobacteria bacterium]|nr:wax ester/triacylglycerol synthase family O-acyltransferase [Actinomycetota bacterium]